MAIARSAGVVIDCPDASALATFYGTLLGWTVEANDGWVDIRPEDGSNCISFQSVREYRAPTWPGQVSPQQMHLDVLVQDLDAAEAVVKELGGASAVFQPGETFRVFLDPAGHPFCLCLS